MAAFDKLQGHSLPPDEIDDEAPEAAASPSAARAARAAPAWRRALFAGGLLAFAALPAWNLIAGSPTQNATPGEMSAAAKACLERALACDAESLPADVGGVRRTNFTAHARDREDLMGAYSAATSFRTSRDESTCCRATSPMRAAGTN